MVEIDGLSELEMVGEGGFAVVYRARQVALDRVVAAKVLKRRFESDRDRQVFQDECKRMGRLDRHPAIASIYSTTFTRDGLPVILMRYAAGGTLAEPLGPRLRDQDILSIGVQIASALAYAHRRGVIHNDIKPSNILLDSGRPFLTDFGISALVGDDSSTRAGGLTFEYAAPEVVDERGEPRSDVYSLAATIYRMLAGRFPLSRDGDTRRGVDDVEWVARILEDAPTPLTEFGFGASIDNVIVNRGLAPIESGRRPTAEQFGSLLRDLEHELGYPVTRFAEVQDGDLPDEQAATLEREPKAQAPTDFGGRTVARPRRHLPVSGDDDVEEPHRDDRSTASKRAVLIGVLVGLAAIIGVLAALAGGGRGSSGDVAQPATAVPTLETLPPAVIAPTDLAIRRVDEGAAVVSWSDPNPFDVRFEVQFVGPDGVLGSFEETDQNELRVDTLDDAESLCVYVRALGERGRVSTDAGPVCVASPLDTEVLVDVVPPSCAPGACDFRLVSQNYTPGGSVSIVVENSDGVDLNAQFGEAYQPRAEVDRTGEIMWRFDPGAEAPPGTYRVEVVDDTTKLSSTATLELTAG